MIVQLCTGIWDNHPCLKTIVYLNTVTVYRPTFIDGSRVNY